MSIISWVKDNWITVTTTVIATVVTGGTNVVAMGIALGAGYLLDTDRKKREQETKELNLKEGVSQQIRDEVTKLQEERAKDASELNTLDQQIAQKQAKLDDPNTPENIKAQIRGELAAMISQRSSKQEAMKQKDDQIKNLIDNASKTITGNKGSSIDPQTKMMLIAAGTVVLIYWLNSKEK